MRDPLAPGAAALRAVEAAAGAAAGPATGVSASSAISTATVVRESVTERRYPRSRGR